jgi:hypothetical protein
MKAPSITITIEGEKKVFAPDPKNDNPVAHYDLARQWAVAKIKELHLPQAKIRNRERSAQHRADQIAILKKLHRHKQAAALETGNHSELMRLDELRRMEPDEYRKEERAFATEHKITVPKGLDPAVSHKKVKY